MWPNIVEFFFAWVMEGMKGIKVQMCDAEVWASRKWKYVSSIISFSKIMWNLS